MRKDTNDYSYARLELRLTQQEKEMIKEKAKEMGMSMSEFIRYACDKIFNQEAK